MNKDDKNVIMVTYDSVRADHCSPYGYERDTTPNLKQMADDGVLFENAKSPASRTNPSMSGIMTGEHLINREKVSNPEISKYHLNRFGTLAEEMKSRGYKTAAFCPNAYASRHYGFDAGFDLFEDFLFDNGLYQKIFSNHLSSSGLFTTIRNIRNLIRREEAFRTWETFIDDVVEWVNTQNEPCFVWIFSLDTHFPYITPREDRVWSGMIDTYYYNYICNSLVDELGVTMSSKTIDGITDIYDDAIRYGDKMLSELLERLSLDENNFLVHSDHGEGLGEHSFYGHFYPSLYEECTHVPLVAYGENIDSTNISRPTSLLEIPNIVGQLANDRFDPDELDQSGYVVNSTYDGRRSRNVVSITTKEHKLIKTIQDEEENIELFDIETDPSESNDISKTNENVRLYEDLADSRILTERTRIRIKDAVSNTNFQ